MSKKNHFFSLQNCIAISLYPCRRQSLLNPGKSGLRHGLRPLKCWGRGEARQSEIESINNLSQGIYLFITSSFQESCLCVFIVLP